MKALTAWLGAVAVLLVAVGCIPSGRPLPPRVAPPERSASPLPQERHPIETVAPEPAAPEPEHEPLASDGEMGTGTPGAKRLTLTLDVGPWADPAIAGEILETLEKEGLRATLFFAGKFVEKHPEVAEKASTYGHQFGNHTYSHPDLTKVSREAIAAELEKTQSLLEEAVGHKITPLYFRPPYGATNKKVKETVEGLGFRSVMWDIEALDWQEGATTEKVVERVTKRAQDGAIILMHITKYTLEAVPIILERLRAEGYEFVSLEEILQANN